MPDYTRCCDVCPPCREAITAAAVAAERERCLAIARAEEAAARSEQAAYLRGLNRRPDDIDRIFEAGYRGRRDAAKAIAEAIARNPPPEEPHGR